MKGFIIISVGCYEMLDVLKRCFWVTFGLFDAGFGDILREIVGLYLVISHIYLSTLQPMIRCGHDDYSQFTAEQHRTIRLAVGYTQCYWI